MTQAFRALSVKTQGIDGHLAFVEPALRKIRVEFSGESIASSTEALIMHETNHQPVYYFPITDVRMDLLELSDRLTH
ncbi:MAG: hypothetical protein CL763_02205 [Chloroflexi bacterium]|nr:hypothetical protein [Chloroflexota bacterium]